MGSAVLFVVAAVSTLLRRIGLEQQVHPEGPRTSLVVNTHPSTGQANLSTRCPFKVSLTYLLRGSLISSDMCTHLFIIHYGFKIDCLVNVKIQVGFFEIGGPPLVLRV